MRVNTEDWEAYKLVKNHGYTIDTRGVRPVLINGLWALSFDTYSDAIRFAIDRIERQEKANDN